MGTRRALRALQGGSFTIEEDPEVITGEAAEELRRFLRARNDRIIREAARMGQLLTDRQTPTNEIVHRIGLPTGFWKGWQRGISRSERDHNTFKRWLYHIHLFNHC
ncbi:hypothetical protein MKW98_000374 [Papaver atlanticum]|uniref:Uncharacterized protein n=1 Tax=Papaver atlanticum TaxID=357466 RepID=A0AAD4S3U9_9MAGN|nr:hypothetical protein MKW98_000374 [Papaver atlanticum]